MITKLKDKILNGYEISLDEAYKLIDADLESLCDAANEICKHFCGDSFDICTIVNGKSGSCSENCKYCAQSTCYSVKIDEYPLLDTDAILESAKYNSDKGILRYSVVTSGKYLSDNEIDKVCESYRTINQSCDVALCASHGLLNYDQFLKLKKAGVRRYHNNLETSREYFPKICTTHTFDDKIEAIKAAQNAGLEVCSGGIMGLGESMVDRISMAMDLRELSIKSTPMNILNPVQGTPFENLSILTVDEVRRIVAIYRFIMPHNAIRLAGGRGLLSDKGRSVFASGANAAISGDMLTTSGISIDDDMKMIEDLGFEVKLI